MAPKIQPKPADLPKASPRPPPAPKPVAPPPAPKNEPLHAKDNFDVSTQSQFEISSTHSFSAAELAQLTRKDKALGEAVANAQTAFKDLVAQGARISVTTSKGNGGKPVVTIIPPALAGSTDATKPYDVQIHYHGTPGSASSPVNDSPVKKRIADTFKQSPPTVFVLPEWKGNENWANVSSTGATADDALKGVVGKRGQLTVSAHSLGRMAVFNAIRAGGLKADRLDMQDAFYPRQPGGPGERVGGPYEVAQWLKQHANDKPPPQVRILTTRGGVTTRESVQKMLPKGLDLPDRLFVDIHKGLKVLPKEPHWDAELKPW